MSMVEGRPGLALMSVVRTVDCMLEMHCWQRVHGVGLQTPSGVQPSAPVLAEQAHALLGSALLQNSPPATLQSLSAAHVAAGFVMLSMG